MAESSHSRVFAPGLLDGQVCVVSGAGSGLGRETALELARLGAVGSAAGGARSRWPRRRRWPPGWPGSFEREALDIRDEEAVDASSTG